MDEVKRCRAIEAESIFDLEDKINDFASKFTIFSTQIFQTPIGGFSCLVWYLMNKAEPVFDKKESVEKEVNFATDKQLSFIKNMMKIPIPKHLTKEDAFKLIKDFKDKGGK